MESWAEWPTEKRVAACAAAMGGMGENKHGYGKWPTRVPTRQHTRVFDGCHRYTFLSPRWPALDEGRAHPKSIEASHHASTTPNLTLIKEAGKGPYDQHLRKNT
jgi:hypothetical protein